MVEIQNLVKRYGQKYALDDISFTVKEGEIVGFLGPNGAGKSTTMNIITGYLSATSGTVLVDGNDVMTAPMEVKKSVGYLPEIPPLYQEMTVLEYLSFVFDLKKCSFNKQAHLKELCDLVKITDVQNRLIQNLSKGYKQRVGIASALIGNPKTVIFDEPTVGLDPKQMIEIRNLIRNLGKSHTVILSTHILSEVQAVCDRIIVINGGKIIADEKTSDFVQIIGQSHQYLIKVAGPNREVNSLLQSIVGVRKVTQVSEREDDAFTYRVQSDPNVDIRKSVFNALAQKGYPMLGMETEKAELEDVFIQLISKKEGQK